MSRAIFTVVNDAEEEVEIPSKYEVCHRCRGNGVHDNTAFENGISSEEFAEDPEFAESYWAGAYDVTCTECGGTRVVAVPDEDRLTPEQICWLQRQRENEAEERAYAQMRRRGIEF